MRATLWIATSGFLLASGPAYGGPGLPVACRSDVLVTEYNLRTPVLAGHPVALTLLTQGRGQLYLSCPLEDVVGALDVP
jgi:hypothetical protein